MIDSTFLTDSIRQLRCGMKVIVFKEKQIEAIKEKLAKMSGNLEITCEKKDYYFVLTPKKRIFNYKHY